MKTNPYTATLLSIGISAIALALILSVATDPSTGFTSYGDTEAQAALLFWAGLLFNIGVPTLLAGLVIAGVRWQSALLVAGLAHVAEREPVAESGSGDTEPESDLGVAGKAIEDGEWPSSN
jgi:hypothetical protein